MSTLNKPSTGGAYQVGHTATGGAIYAPGHHQVRGMPVILHYLSALLSGLEHINISKHTCFKLVLPII